MKDQSEFTRRFIIENDIRNIMEIGFNAGVSSSVMLSSNEDVRVTSFDIGEHYYMKDTKKIIDEMFPGRHTLILGDSTVTVPQYTGESAPFDMVFVDGGHHGDVPELDIRNSCKFLKRGGFIILDDFCEWYGADVIKGAKNCFRDGLIRMYEKSGPFFGDGDRAWEVFVLC